MASLNIAAVTFSSVSSQRIAERVILMAGPAFLKPSTYARLLTMGLRILRRTPRA